MVKPMPPYFLVSIPKKDQKERKEKIGSIYLHPTYIFLTRNMQCGEIVAIGSQAAELLPDASVGDTLLFHHFVESLEKCQCVDSDDNFNYYVVTACYHNGQNNQTYGIWNGKNIIPHPDYIFLACETEDNATALDEFLHKKTAVNENGILQFNDWKITREDITRKMEKIKNEIESLAKTKMREDVAREINRKESEMNELSKLMHKKRYQLYSIFAINPSFNLAIANIYGCWLASGSKVYMLNIACETKIEFDRKEYIVAKSQHFGVPHSWVQRKFTTTT